MKCVIPCVGRIDAAAVLVCYIPLSVITYGCCYLMLIFRQAQIERQTAAISLLNAKANSIHEKLDKIHEKLVSIQGPGIEMIE